MPSPRRRLLGGGDLAIKFLVLHAILVHLYILRLSDVVTTPHGGGGAFLPQQGGDWRLGRRSKDEGDNNVVRNTTLVVYSGPNDAGAPLAELYERNLDYFLLHGVDCDDDVRDDGGGGGIGTTDTVIIVGHEYYDSYLPRIRLLNDLCRRSYTSSSSKGDGLGTGRRGGDSVLLVARRNVCYDMESARLALFGGVAGLPPPSYYDYFVFVNCGVTGPALPPLPSSGEGGRAYRPRRRRWTSHFIELLDGTVKMTGLTLNCETEGNEHIMSMMYAVDRIGLDLIMRSGAIYDCLLDAEGGGDFINSYERKMGRAILDAGYGLRPLMRHRWDVRFTRSNADSCAPCGGDKYPHSRGNDITGLVPTCNERDHYRDIWIGSRLKSLFDGRIPLLEDVIFFKTSRYLSNEISAQINFTGTIDWNWD
ncbi:hypothetical protein ACHAW5_000614 [Stephanodiscus triporus]|uniref:Uncharacterized protein n=1 Tax=Stephanodiscus triporus TaxID=2934178 RepID=A0ABD3MZS0_9STRA